MQAELAIAVCYQYRAKSDPNGTQSEYPFEQHPGRGLQKDLWE